MTTSCELESDVEYWRLVILMAMTMAATMGVKAAETSADQRFEALSSAEYEWRRAQFAPGEDDAEGAPRRLPDVGPAAQAERLQRWTRTSAALDAIDPGALSAEQRVNYVVYKGQIAALLDAQKYREYEKPLNSDASFSSDKRSVGKKSVSK